MLMTAYDEAVLGLAEGGIPIGAALYSRDGTLISSGHNRRVQGARRVGARRGRTPFAGADDDVTTPTR